MKTRAHHERVPVLSRSSASECAWLIQWLVKVQDTRRMTSGPAAETDERSVRAGGWPITPARWSAVSRSAEIADSVRRHAPRSPPRASGLSAAARVLRRGRHHSCRRARGDDGDRQPGVCADPAAAAVSGCGSAGADRSRHRERRGTPVTSRISRPGAGQPDAGSVGGVLPIAVQPDGRRRAGSADVHDRHVDAVRRARREARARRHLAAKSGFHPAISRWC